MKRINTLILVFALLLVGGSVAYAQLGGPGWNEFEGSLRVLDDFNVRGDANFDVGVTTPDLTTTDDVTVGDDLSVVGNVGALTQAQDTENVGQLPTWLSVPVTYTDQTVATIADGEVWVIHDIFVNITTNFDCTGNDCAVAVGDSGDADGFLVLADATLQAADVDGPTGFYAGWQGFQAATRGVYFDEATSEAHHSFVYAPSSGTDAIVWDVSGTDPAAGAGVLYIHYTRLE